MAPPTHNRSRTFNLRSKPYERQVSNGSWKHDKFDNKSNSSNESFWKVQVSNLHWNVSEDDLEELFGNEIGGLERVKLKYDLSGRSEGIADLIFKSQEYAVSAISTFDGQELDAMPMMMEMMGQFTPRSTRKSGMVSGIEARLGPPSIEKRLGARIGDRLGPKVQTSTSFRRSTNAKSGNKRNQVIRKSRQPVNIADLDAEMDAYMNTDAPQVGNRPIISYQGTEPAVSDGQLV